MLISTAKLKAKLQHPARHFMCIRNISGTIKTRERLINRQNIWRKKMRNHVIFNSHDEARIAIQNLRDAGVRNDSISVIALRGDTLTTTNVNGEVTDEEDTSIIRGILGGGALGAGLSVAALAIPGVGPLIAGGAIAAAAVPGAVGAGALAGAALGSVNELLKDHGVDDQDAEYYSGRMKDGAVFVSVDEDSSGYDPEETSTILHRSGGHNSRLTRI